MNNNNDNNISTGYVGANQFATPSVQPAPKSVSRERLMLALAIVGAVFFFAAIIVLVIALNGANDRAAHAEERLTSANAKLSDCGDALDKADEAFELTSEAFGYVTLMMEGDYYSLSEAADGLTGISGQLGSVADGYIDSAEKCRDNSKEG